MVSSILLSIDQTTLTDLKSLFEIVGTDVGKYALKIIRDADADYVDK